MKEEDKNDLINCLIIHGKQNEGFQLEELFKSISDITFSVKSADYTGGLEQASLYQPDLLFICFQKTASKTFKLITQIKNHITDPSIVLIADSDKYALPAIKYSILDYLTTPVDKTSLNDVFQRYVHSAKYRYRTKLRDLYSAKSNGKATIRINTRAGFYVIKTGDIIYIQAEGNYSRIFLKNNSEILTSVNLGRLMQNLPEHIFRISRNTAINLGYLREVNRKNRICRIEIEERELLFHISGGQIRIIEENFF